MRWKPGRRSTNIEDRRGRRVRRGAAGGGMGLLLLLVVALFFGVDPMALLQVGGSEIVSERTSTAATPAEAERVEFVSAILADLEDTWHALFQEMKRTYEEPILVLFTGSVQSACGFAQSAVGPFYCPADHKLYIDLSFYDDLQRRFGAPGDFAQAYIVAHEVAHHVQNLLGISSQVAQARRRVSETQGNQLSVMQELQADCLSGVWGYHADRARQMLEAGDLEEALNAAAAIGDDRLQRRARGYVTLETFTHGSSEQRVYWFRRGFESGSPDSCDTFAGGA